MECPICLNNWNSSKNVPYMVSCGHSFCKECLLAMIPKVEPESKISNLTLSCPTCMKDLNLHQNESKSDPGEKWLGSLIKNFSLISLVEQNKSEKTPNDENKKKVMFSNENLEIETNQTLDDWEMNVTTELDRSLSMISAMRSEEKHTMNDVNLM